MSAVRRIRTRSRCPIPFRFGASVPHRHQRRALALWPKVWSGWSPGELVFYRECERYNQKVLEFRLAKPD